MIYDTKYGATFNYNYDGSVGIRSYHSMRDLGLYPRSKPIISPPQPKTSYMDIPGADGHLDFTESLDGEVHYENRKGTFPYVFLGPRSQWDAIYHRLQSAVHGKKMAVRLDEDPGGYYYGRITVEAPEYDKNGTRMYLTVTADLDPWFYDLWSSTQPWIWDEFNFETGIIRDYTAITVVQGASAITYTIVGSPRPVCPIFKVKGTLVSMTYYVDGSGVTRNMVGGSGAGQWASYQWDDFILRDGERDIELSGDGTLAIEFRGGCL